MTEMTTETKFEVGKWYKRGNGELIRVVCVDAPGDFPVIGHDRIGNVVQFTAMGWFWDDIPSESSDIIPTPIEPKKKGVVWVNVFNGGSGLSVHTDREQADYWPNTQVYRLARVKVEWEEGRFDE